MSISLWGVIWGLTVAEAQQFTRDGGGLPISGDHRPDLDPFGEIIEEGLR